MSIPTWFRAPRFRRGLAAAAVVLAAGGLILYRAPASAKSASDVTGQEAPADAPRAAADGDSTIAFHGPGVRGTVALSHTKVLAGGTTRVFAELTMTADAK